MGRIVVVGAGIVGLSVARAALRRGHAVTVLDRGDIPNAEAASSDAHRMIRYHYGDAAGYTRMVRGAFAAWDAVWDDLGDRHFVDVGAIAIAETADDYAHRTLATFRETGVPHDVLDRAGIERLCPHFDVPEGSFGVVAGPGGPLFARRIIEGLARFVADRGAVLRPHTPAAAVDRAAGQVTLTSGEVVTGDAVVVAAGAWLPGLMPDPYGALPVMRQALCYVAPPAAYAESWSRAPALVSFGDRGIYTLPGLMGTDLKFGYGDHRRRGRPEDGFATAPAEADAVLNGFGGLLRDRAGYRPLRLQPGYYVMDGSRRFRLDAHGRTVVVTNCDGQMFKFGPLLGERILAAIDGDDDLTALARWAAGD